MEIKQTCDGNCSTCPPEFKIHCALTYSKRNNELLEKLSNRLDAMENNMVSSGAMFPTPQGLEEMPTPQASENEVEE